MAYPHNNNVSENNCSHGNSVEIDRDMGTLDIDKVIEYTINKCRVSEEFNREFVDLLCKHTLWILREKQASSSWLPKRKQYRVK